MEAEDAAPHAIEMHGNYRHIQSLDDLFQAALKRQQVAGPADRTFGEDADHVALSQFLARIPNGSCDFAHGPAADRHGFGQTKEPVERLHFVIRAPHHEADEALDRRANQEPVDVRHMVGNQQRRAARRHVLRSHDPDLVQRVRRHPQNEPYQEVRHHSYDVDGSGQRHYAENEHQLVRRNMHAVVQNPQSSRSQQQPEGVIEIVGGNRAPFVRRSAALLQERIQRHDEQAARNSQHRECRHGPSVR